MALPQFHSIIPLPIFGNGIATITQKKNFHLFWQYHCHNYQKKKLPISAIPLPQFFFSSHFRQWHCHNYQKKKFIYFGNPIATIFFFFLPHIFSNSITEIGENFFHLFRQCHCHNSIPLFPFPFSVMALPQLPKKKFRLLPQFYSFFFPHIFGNAIATIPFFFFFFLEMISAQNFYNIFTITFKWQVVIVGLKK